MKKMWTMVVGINLLAVFSNAFAANQGAIFNSWFIPVNLLCLFYGTYKLTRSIKTEKHHDTYNRVEG